MEFLDFEDKDPFSWNDDKKNVLPPGSPTLAVYWDDETANYLYRFDNSGLHYFGDAAWAVRLSKHYNIPMPKVQADPTTKKKPLGEKK